MAARLSIAWLSLTILLAGRTTLAGEDETARARELSKKAKSHYAVGEYDQAAEAYQEAYKIKPDPALLFNAAQNFRLGGKTEKALTLYRNYVRIYPSEKNVEDVKGQITKLEAQLETERAAKNGPPPMGAPPPMVAAAPAPAAAVTASPADTAAPAAKPMYKKPWFWAVLGGVVLAGVGVAVLTGSGGSAWNNVGDVKQTLRLEGDPR